MPELPETETIARALDVAETAGASTLTALTTALRDRRLLLALDNMEQVSAAAPEVVALLAACPPVRAVATSRAALRVQGGQEYAVLPLAVPGPTEPLDALHRAAAVQLFVARARAVRLRPARWRNRLAARWRRAPSWNCMGWARVRPASPARWRHRSCRCWSLGPG